MDIQIDRDELERIQRLRQAEAPAQAEDILSADFISFGTGGPEGGEGGEKGKGRQEEGETGPKADATAAPHQSPSQPTRRRPAETTASVLRFDVPWMVREASAYSACPTERLHQELVDFAQYVSPTEEERFARTEAIRRLTSTVEGLWPDASVQIFGSVDSGLYLPHSDLDAVVVCASLPTDALSKPPLAKLAKALLRAKIPLPESVRVIARARVPIIKYIDAQTDYEVDVSFNVTSGLDAAKFMRHEMRSQPAVRPLTLVLKHFLQMRSLNEVFSGGLGSYSIMCLVISFLQMHPLVQSGLIRAHENLGVLLMEFFELYGRNHSSELVGIEVSAGGRYYDKSDYGWRQESKPHLLSIRDPQDDANDISKGSFAYGAVRQAFEHAFNVLKCAMAELEEYQRAVGDGRRSPSRHLPSLLGSIVTLEPKLLRHRYYIQQTSARGEG